QIYVVDDVRSKVAAYQALGRTYAEKLENERAALDAWINALELDPANLVTLETLRVIYLRNQAWVELVDILRRLIEIGAETLGVDRLRALYAEIGEIQGEHLLATDEAIAAWRQVLELDPSDMEALAALERLYSEQARWVECMEIL